MDPYDSLEFDFLLDDFLDYDAESASTTSEELSSTDDNSLILSPIINQKDVKPKKKRIRKRTPWPVAPGPVVVRNDIRRSYANMFVNVMNSCDFHLLYGMLDTFFLPNFQQTFKKTINGAVHEEHQMIVRGVHQAAQQWFTSLLMVPDIVVDLSNTTIEYHNGKIIATMSMSATRLYEDSVSLSTCSEVVTDQLNRLDLNNSESDVENGEQIRKKSCPLSDSHDLQQEKVDDCATSTDRTVKKLLNSVQTMMNGLVRRKEPEVFNAKGTFIMYTNDDKLITAMDWFADTTYAPTQLVSGY